MSARQAVVIGGEQRGIAGRKGGPGWGGGKGRMLPEAHEVEACTAEHAVA